MQPSEGTNEGKRQTDWQVVSTLREIESQDILYFFPHLTLVAEFQPTCVLTFWMLSSPLPSTKTHDIQELNPRDGVTHAFDPNIWDEIDFTSWDDLRHFEISYSGYQTLVIMVILPSMLSFAHCHKQKRLGEDLHFNALAEEAGDV